MPTHTCPKCSKEFTDKSTYNRHLARKTPCAPILDPEDLPDDKKESPHKCKFCGRVFTRAASVTAHMKKACKIVPREGNSDGMEKLYEHTLRKQQAQMEAMQARMELLEAQVKASASVAAEAATAALVPQAVVQNRLAHGGPSAAPVTKIIHTGAVTNVGTLNANIDNSIGKTTMVVNISIFGQENLGRITKPQVFDLLKGLGPVGENVKAIAEKAIIQAAMLIFSDPVHPEDITCYLPNKKGDNALVHGESGWEVQPVGLVVSPMAAQSIETLFKHQPAPDQHTPENDVKWMMEECGNIMRYIQRHEGDLTNEPPRGELRGILIRNKELLQQVLARLPMVGQK
jgi:uncharacterized C2H2 Zn-finger protein